MSKKGNKYISKRQTRTKTMRQWVNVMEELLEYASDPKFNACVDIRSFFNRNHQRPIETEGHTESSTLP